MEATVPHDALYYPERPVADNDRSALIQQKISATLLKNRFNPGGESPFIQNRVAQAPFRKLGGPGAVLGKYNTNFSAEEDVTFQQLRQIGVRLMLAATGQDVDTTDSDSLLLDGAGVFGMASIQKQTRKIQGLGKLSALSVAKHIPPNPGAITDMHLEIPDSTVRGSSDTDAGDGSDEFNLFDAGDHVKYNNESWGQLNTSEEHFNGPLPVSMIVICVSDIIETIGAMLLIEFLIQWVGDDENLPEAGKDPSWAMQAGYKYVKGSRRTRVDNAKGSTAWLEMLQDMFGWPDINHRFTACMSMGMQLFFGWKPIPPGFNDAFGSPGGQSDIEKPTSEHIIDSATNLLMSPGYYVTIMRQVTRGIHFIVDAGEDMANQFSSGGIAGGIQGIATLLEEFSTSATWRWLMMTMITGDLYLRSQVYYAAGVEQANPDYTDEIAENTVRKSRVGGPGGGASDPRLAWRHGSSARSYLYPLTVARLSGEGSPAFGASQAFRNSVVGTIEDLTGDWGPLFKDGAKLAVTTEGQSRLSPEVVAVVESSLDSEYMPFYFHDLRTNEITSFHAFLHDLNETFSPEWNSTSGLGRVDEIKTYSKTARSLSFSFVVASTMNSGDDFNLMWYDVNRLIAMLYPQFSAGSMHSALGGEGAPGEREAIQFRMPFSQIQTASPVIRLRIGDLISSNYSKFGIARLFGFGEQAVLNSLKKSKHNESYANAATEASIITHETKFRAARKKKIMGFKNLIADLKPSSITADMVIKNKALGCIIGDYIQLSQGATFQVVNKAGKEQTWNDLKKFPWLFGEVGLAAKQFPEKKKAMRKVATLTATKVVKVVVETVITEKDGKTLVQNINASMFRWGSDTSPFGSSAQTAEFNKDNAFWFKLDMSKMSVVDKLPKKEEVKTPGGQPNDCAELMRGEIEKGIKASLASVETFDIDSLEIQKKYFNDGATDPKNPNPILQSFRVTQGKGLAGVITSFSIDYGESTWEIDLNKKAPQFMRISIGFDVIHDIVPGLDSSGFMRAPTHPVGDYARALGPGVTEFPAGGKSEGSETGDA